MCLRFLNIKTVTVPMISRQTTQRLIIKGSKVSAKKGNQDNQKGFKAIFITEFDHQLDLSGA